MKPAVVFGDPEAALVEHLTTAWSGRDEPYKPSRIATDFPVEPLEVGDTRIQVDLESGNVDDYPVTERAQVRITCHAPALERSAVKGMASLAQSLACQHPGSTEVAGVFASGGRSGVITDPDTGNLMVWFLVRVALLALPLAP